jgi:uncharacterized protein (TIGR01777 family)
LSAVEGSDTILVSGATGLVGGRWLQRLSPDVSVRMLTRRAREPRPGSPEPVVWNGRDLPEGALADAGAVVHLSGEPIFGGIPTAARRRRMVDSRVASTASIVDAMGRLPAGDRPDVLVCASAVGIYGDRGEEESAAPGSGFLARLCEDWEAAARAAESHGVRVVSLRIGLVLAREGGALAGLRHLFRLGLGGPIAHGRQWMPWIHVDDLARLLEAVRRPALLRAPAFALRASLGPLASELLDSRRVIPARAQALGFDWRHADIASALAEELS